MHNILLFITDIFKYCTSWPRVYIQYIALSSTDTFSMKVVAEAKTRHNF